MTTEQERLSSEPVFQDKYEKVLKELDVLFRGVFDESDAKPVAALCLQAKVGLIKKLSAAEALAKGLKADIGFAKADAYHRIKSENDGKKKITESAMDNLVLQDHDVRRLTKEQIQAEKEARELSQLLDVLTDAHITFRAVKKGDV